MSNVSFESIGAIGYIFSDNLGRKQHRLILTDNKVKQDDRFNIASGEILTRDFNYIGTVLNINNGPIYWTCYTRESASRQRSKLRTLPMKFELTKAGMNYSNVILSSEAAYSCAACNNTGPGCNPVGDCMTTVPDPGECTAEMVAAQGSNFNNNFTVDLDEIRAIRDNFMNSYAKTKKYIDYYYKIGRVAGTYQTINPGTFQQHANVLTDVISSVRILRGNSEIIVINNQQRDRFLSMINYYKNVSSNAEFQQILQSIERDVNSYSNITRSHFLIKLQNDQQ